MKTNRLSLSKSKKVTIAYDLTVDGRLIKSVHLQYVQGKDGVPLGLERSLKGLKVGDHKEIILSSKESYGAENPKLIVETPKLKYATKYHLIGKEIKSQGGKYLATVKDVRQKTLLLDFNHPFAGKKLCYDVRVLDIKGRQADCI